MFGTDDSEHVAQKSKATVLENVEEVMYKMGHNKHHPCSYVSRYNDKVHIRLRQSRTAQLKENLQMPQSALMLNAYDAKNVITTNARDSKPLQFKTRKRRDAFFHTKNVIDGTHHLTTSFSYYCLLFVSSGVGLP